MQYAENTRDVTFPAPERKAVRYARPREEIAREGDLGEHCFLVTRGVVCRTISGRLGDRQIVGFQTVGDICGNLGFAADRLDYAIEALSHVTFVPICVKYLSELAESSHAFHRALRHQVSVDAAISRQWIFNLGRRRAYQRLAHLICEIEARLSAAGLVQDAAFRWYGTQNDLGAAVGLSLVHVNRTLRRLEEDGLVQWGGTVKISNLARLREIAGFDPDYLRLDEQSLGSLLLSRDGYPKGLGRDDREDARGAEPSMHVTAVAQGRGERITNESPSFGTVGDQTC